MPKSTPNAPIKKILVIGNQLLGDTLATYTLLYSIFAHSKHSFEWHLLSSPYTASLYQNLGFFSHTFFYDNKAHYKKKKLNPLKKLFLYIKLYRQLHSQHYHLALILPGGFGFALLCFLLKIPHRIGHDTDYRKSLLTHSHPLDPHISNEANYLNLLKLIPKVKFFSDSKHPIPIQTYTLKCQKPHLKSLPQKNYYIVAACASEDNKIWSPKHFIALCRLIFAASNSTLIPVCLGIDAERPYLDEIAKHCQGLNLAGCLSLTESAFLIKKSRFYVGLDTGLAHIAGNLQKKSFILYGPSNFILSQPSSIPKNHKDTLIHPIYRSHPHIPPHHRKKKRYRHAIDINLITPAEVFKVICDSNILNSLSRKE